MDEVSYGQGGGASPGRGVMSKLFRLLAAPERRMTVFTIVFLAVALIALVWFIVAKTSGEVADLHLSPSSTSATVGTPFNVDMSVDTHNNNVVAVKAVIQYDPANFTLLGVDTSASAFSTGNTCLYNSKPCEIIVQDAANGKATVTLAKPTPGVNTASGKIATLQFRALQPVVPSSANITIQYVAYGNYTDSDVIFDDGLGTDILNSATNTTVTASLEVPSGLAAPTKTATTVGLTWAAASANSTIVSYKIYRNGTQVGTSSTPSYTDTGLTPLTAYTYRISGVNGSGVESSQSSQVSATTLADTTAPSVPAGLTATANGMDKVDLSWTASTDDVAVTGYQVYRCTGASCSNYTQIGTPSGTTYNDTGLTAETTYRYRVAAVDAAGNASAQGTAVSATTAQDSAAPTVPTGVSATAVSISQINLSWTASTDNIAVTGYKVYRCTGASCSNYTQVGTPSGTTYNDTGLTVSTTYRYQVTALDARGNESARSTTVSAATNSDTTAPSVPSGLSGTAVSMTAIDLTWTASTDNVGVAGYRVFRNGTQVGTTSATTYSDTGLTKSTAYSYTVLAYDAAGNPSAQTTPVSVTTLNDTTAPSVPTGLSGTAVSMTAIDLTWTASTDNIAVTGYKVFRNGTQIADVTTGTSYSDTGLTQNTNYSYTALAYDADGNQSAQTSAISVKTLAKTYSISDFTALVSVWLQNVTNNPSDVNNDGVVNTRDIGIMMSNWQ
ncbi:MAG: fibronectin type III domain-containing protein [Candidatus Moraniibacteriota bacterium]|nr:MAG: fibronectin type III domain-containing protein [Candidatus Moranbacteria bacterium]